MAYCTVSIGSGVVDSLYGKSQFPIKSYLETKGEEFGAVFNPGGGAQVFRDD